MSFKPTNEELGVMAQVMYGADIYSSHEARVLRDVQRKQSEAGREYLTVCEPMFQEVDGALQQPYFGAILTPVGAAYVIAAMRVLEMDEKECGEFFKELHRVLLTKEATS